MIIAELADDKTTLVSCAQVCRLWAAEATSLLWQNANLPSTLVDHMEPARIQFYAKKIRSLDLFLESPWRKFLSGVEFPCLSKIRITATHHRWPTTTRRSLALLTKLTSADLDTWEVCGRCLANREKAGKLTGHLAL